MTLAAKDLAIERGGACILRGVSATLEAGTITAIVGPNGAGKSSLLMTLAGLLDPVGGDVLLDGEDLHTLPASLRARAIGYLPQNGDIAWDVAVEALVALGRMPHNEGRGDGRSPPVEAAIEALDLQTLRSRPASTLSGGERARTLLARVLAGEPEWILADEPLAALDLAHQLRIISHLKESARQGAGVAIVVHDLATAMNHADRVLVLGHGEMVADGAPQEALAPSVIEEVWRIKAHWVRGTEMPGQQALVTYDPD